MAPSGGTAYIDVVPDFRGFTSALKAGMRVLSRNIEQVGDTIAAEVTRPLERAGREAEAFGREASRAFDSAEGSAGDLARAADGIEEAFLDAASGLDKIDGDALDDVVAMLGRTTAEARDARDELARVQQELDDLRRARGTVQVGVEVDTGNVRSELGKIPDKIDIKADVDASGFGRLKGESDRAGEGVIASVRKWSASVATIIAGIAVLGIAPWVKVFSDAAQWDEAFRGMEASLGQRGKEVADAAGRIAAEVYMDAWGESIGEVGSLVAQVIKELPKQSTGVNEFGLLELAGFDPEKDLEAVQTATGQIFALAQLTGEDATRVVTAARQLIVNGLAKDWTEALDLIGYSAQELNDPLNELLDVFTEYPTKFRDLGLSGEMVIGFLDQMVESGAPSLDKAADALKEFSIRAIDGSKSTEDAFKKLGLAPDKMAEEFAAGGPRASAAFIKVVEAIQDAARNSDLAADEIGAALFGTPWEDLGASILALDPAELQVAADGAAGKIAATLGSSLSAAWEGLKRTVFTGLSLLFSDPDDGLVVTVRRSIESGFAGDQFDFSGTLTAALGKILSITQQVWSGEIAPERAGQMVAALLVAILDSVSSLFGGDASGKAGETANDVGTFFQTVWNDPALRAKLDTFKATLESWYFETVLPFLLDAAKQAGAAFITGIKEAAIGEVNKLNPSTIFLNFVLRVGLWLQQNLGNAVSTAIAYARTLLTSAITSGGTLGFVLNLFGRALPEPPGIPTAPESGLVPPEVPFLAEGGIIERPTLSVVGEAGPEAVVPLSRLDRYIEPPEKDGEQPIYLRVQIGDRDITDMIERTVRNNDVALAGALSRGRRV